MSVSLNASFGSSSPGFTKALWLSCNSRFKRILDNENAETRGCPSLSSTRTTAGFTISGSSTSSSFAGSGVRGAGEISMFFTTEFSTAIASEVPVIMVSRVIVVVTCTG